MMKFLRRFRQVSAPEQDRADLISSLAALTPDASYTDQVQALSDIMDWIRLPIFTEDENPLRSRTIRIKFLFQFLERNPEHAQNLARTIQSFIIPGDAVGLYCMTGISENTGFLNELTNRLVKRILPEVHEEKDLAEKFHFIFSNEQDADWLENAYEEIIPLFLDFSRKHEINFTAAYEDTNTALSILGSHVVVLATSQEIRTRLIIQRLADLSFISLDKAINTNAPATEIYELIQLCREDLQGVRQNIDETGVSVDLILKLEKIHSLLSRIEMIYMVRESQSEEKIQLISSLLARLIRAKLKGLGVKEYLQENLHLLTRKIVERAGERGVHYIIQGPEDQKPLFVAACWAGVLTAFTAIGKYSIGIMELPLFFEWFFFFVNYAISFLLLQKFHLALSSKQPAYMASALSFTFEEFKFDRRLDTVSKMIRKITRSQVIATLGNLVLVIPLIVVLDTIWFLISGDHIVSRGEARDILSKHHPLESLTIFYAALTGVFLWISSVVAGWMENWLVFRNIPLAIKQSPVMNRLFSKEKLESISSNLAGTLGGISGNLTIAFLLATPIMISKVTAIPMDIRHVTLATGTMMLSLCSLGWELAYWPHYLMVIISVIIIGILNFSVSFYCSVRMAAIAREIDSKYLKIIFRNAFKKRRPESVE